MIPKEKAKDAEYKCLFNHKWFCGTLKRLFCIARVIGRFFTH